MSCATSLCVIAFVGATTERAKLVDQALRESLQLVEPGCELPRVAHSEDDRPRRRGRARGHGIELAERDRLAADVQPGTARVGDDDRDVLVAVLQQVQHRRSCRHRRAVQPVCPRIDGAGELLVGAESAGRQPLCLELAACPGDAVDHRSRLHRALRSRVGDRQRQRRGRAERAMQREPRRGQREHRRASAVHQHRAAREPIDQGGRRGAHARDHRERAASDPLHHDLLDVVDAAYQVDLLDDHWLQGLAHAARPHLDRGFGVAGFEYFKPEGAQPTIILAIVGDLVHVGRQRGCLGSARAKSRAASRDHPAGEHAAMKRASPAGCAVAAVRVARG